MSKYVVAKTTASWDSIKDAFDSGQYIVPVVDPNGQYVGFVREHDADTFGRAGDVQQILAKVSAIEPARRHFAVQAGSAVADAMQTMSTFHADFVPVIDNKGLFEGIIDLSDLKIYA